MAEICDTKYLNPSKLNAKNHYISTFSTSLNSKTAIGPPCPMTTRQKTAFD